MSIFGNGFIAKNLKKIKFPKKFDIYAAGVSNSNLKKKSEYKKELKLFENYLARRNKKKILVYISSTSLLNKSSEKDNYISNKKKIENIIKKKVPKYLIVRLPQVIGISNNRKTLTNFIRDNILNKKTFYLWKGSKRNLIDIEDIKIILNKYLRNKPKINKTINILNPRSIKVKDLIKLFSKILKKKPKIQEIKKKNKNIDLLQVSKSTSLPKVFYKDIQRKNYIKSLILKYYK